MGLGVFVSILSSASATSAFLPTGLGAAEITDDVPDDVVRAAWEHVGAVAQDR